MHSTLKRIDLLITAFASPFFFKENLSSPNFQKLKKLIGNMIYIYILIDKILMTAIEQDIILRTTNCQIQVGC